uniref:Uncharacterized protein n=1 Tax=Rhizophora mucronata TaxID=61149 RepID=A0A2P2IHA5_RHIMU
MERGGRNWKRDTDE